MIVDQTKQQINWLLLPLHATVLRCSRQGSGQTDQSPAFGKETTSCSGARAAVPGAHDDHEAMNALA